MEDNNNELIYNMDLDSTLEELSKGLKADETLVLDIEDDSQNQTDVIYDTLVLKGYSVIRNFIKGKSIIIVNKNKNLYI
ncbi:hypothetical protein Bccel_3880 [Pseudobacteroides cellulosolvens ATCC 35603 = DSM 2933]|uniref:Uncharacterized protein n=1 Tax=Pseudobacteroides cellulosolvens ATCC 35603 = DSM 2933 TaxID=398512 RepID=A0A0L6JRZ1_9FIRM|nr:hypothetical protein Bccel_3880 [Pseudobacteroides cellulosolvens ATCC 35603 = DSM 2933]